MLKQALLAVMMGATLSVPVMAHAQDYPAQDVSDATDLGNLEALDTRPNTLHMTEGLHQGKVPLNTISPATVRTFVQVVDLMRREYVEQIDDDKLFYHAINGMLTGIDRNAEFLDATAFANLQSFTEGQVAGVGLFAQWRDDDNHWVVTRVLPNSSAANAGIKTGDYLHQIGEIKLAQSHSNNDLSQLLSGILGTKVTVVYSSAGRSKRQASLLRTQAQSSSIEVLNQDGTVIIKLPIFQKNTRQQILDHISHIGMPVRGIIIDVRNNPGGVLDSAVDVASLFMRKQMVTQVQNRQGIERVLETHGSPLLEGIPVIILQNRYSASASEVLSSALQSQNRALIVGETSYGKGSVQSVIPLGKNQGVKLTTAHYLTPKGEKIDGVGVVPDVTFEKPSQESDSWMTSTLELMDLAKLPAQDGIEFSPIGGF